MPRNLARSRRARCVRTRVRVRLPVACALARSTLLCTVTACIACVTAPIAIAQAPLHVRGEIVAMQGVVPDPVPLRVRLRDGSELTIALAYNFQSFELGPADRARLAPGARVAIASVPASDGTRRALGVLVYPAGYTGGGAGEQPWDLATPPSLTVATIDAVVVRGAVREVTLHDAGTIVVADDVPVVAMLGGARTVLKPGTPISINATRQRDGTITAGRIYYGNGGFTPPF
jgi:hypothetical protein